MSTRGRPRTFDRQEALQSALTVFLARGYDGATLEDLLKAMGGIAPPSFYSAFGSKDKLFREAVDLYCETVGKGPRQALEAPTAREAIEQMLRATAEMVSAPGGPRGCLLILAAMNSTRANSDAHEHLRTIRCRAPKLIRERLECGVADGELPDGLDLNGIASFYTTVAQGLAIRARDGASRADLAAAVDGALAAWPTLTSSRKRSHPLAAKPRGRTRTRR